MKILAVITSWLVLVMTVVVIYVHNVTLAGMVSTYQDRCMDIEAGEALMAMSQALVAINEICIKSQQRQSRWPDALFRRAAHGHDEIRGETGDVDEGGSGPGGTTQVQCVRRVGSWGVGGRGPTGLRPGPG